MYQGLIHSLSGVVSTYTQRVGGPVGFSLRPIFLLGIYLFLRVAIGLGLLYFAMKLYRMIKSSY